MKDNKNKAEQKQQEHKVAKDEAVKSPETKESIMAKQIIDLQTANEEQKKQIAERDEAIKQAHKQLEDYANQYKELIAQAEAKANALIQKNFDQNKEAAKAELVEAKKYAIEDHALELIATINDLERACNFPTDDPKIKNFLVGFKMILTKFNNLLSEMHIEIINPNVGDKFDPATMECFTETVNDPSKQNDTIVSVLEKGYKLYKHILKPALVKVIKNN